MLHNRSSCRERPDLTSTLLSNVRAQHLHFFKCVVFSSIFSSRLHNVPLRLYGATTAWQGCLNIAPPINSKKSQQTCRLLPAIELKAFLLVVTISWSDQFQSNAPWDLVFICWSVYCFCYGLQQEESWDVLQQSLISSKCLLFVPLYNIVLLVDTLIVSAA